VNYAFLPFAFVCIEDLIFDRLFCTKLINLLSVPCYRLPHYYKDWTNSYLSINKLWRNTDVELASNITRVELASNIF